MSVKALVFVSRAGVPPAHEGASPGLVCSTISAPLAAGTAAPLVSAKRVVPWQRSDVPQNGELNILICAQFRAPGQERGRLVRVLGIRNDSRGRGVRAP